ncbi:MAG: thiamine biosynthesis protein ThiF [Planctomycetaceae bacterium]|nr:thiamine biosynthesis protein ThiF [Planctomycetaceae bacterium]
MTDPDRYRRQVRLPGIGEEGQARLGRGTVLVAGCGALGTVAADLLCRAGVGTLVIVDRDLVESTNLQRQTLFTERDAERSTPKAEAARLRLAQANSTVRIRAFVDEIDSSTIESLAAGCDLVVDGLDNFETRYLLNDFAVSQGIPYLYGAGVATEGMSMPVLSRRGPGASARIRWSESESTPCLRCLFPTPPPAGTTPTCETAGVLGSVTMTVAAHQATQAIKLLVGDVAAVDRTLRSFDLWKNANRSLDIDGAMDPDCPCCVGARYEHLHAAPAPVRILCGRNAVQIRTGDGQVDLDPLADRFAGLGVFERVGTSLRGRLRDERSPDGSPVSLVVFADGRAIIEGGTDPDWALGVFDRIVGR